MFSLNNIALHPSRALLLISSGVCLSVLCALLVSDISLFSKVLLLVGFIFYSAHFYLVYISLRDPFSIVGVSWDCNAGLLRFRQLNGEWLVVEKIYQKAISPWLIVLCCSVEQRLLPVTVVIVADCCENDVFRRLQVCSRLANAGDPAVIP